MEVEVREKEEYHGWIGNGADTSPATSIVYVV